MSNLKTFSDLDRRERLGSPSVRIKEVLKPVVREYSLGEVKKMFEDYFSVIEKRIDLLLSQFQKAVERTDLASPDLVDKKVKENFDNIKDAFKTEMANIRKEIRNNNAPASKEVIYAKPPVVSVNNIKADGTQSGSTFLRGDGVWATPSGSGTTSYRTSFTDASLSAGVLTVTHSLGQSVVNVMVFDNNNKNVRPDDITLVDSNSLTVDLTSFGTLTGTWNVVVNS